MPRPLVIGGAGCAGLSLAAHLVDQGVVEEGVAGREAGRRVVLVEPRTRYVDDRTWCFWRGEPHLFEHCVRHAWTRWSVRTDETDVVVESAEHPYQHLPAAAFYREALGRLRRAPGVELRLGARVLGVEEHADGVRVETDAGALDAEYFFDSRPAPPRGGLVQSFVGRVIRARRPIFDDTTATLMDFRRAAAGPGCPERAVDTVSAQGVRFIYLLPFSPREALVEATEFSSESRPPKVYERMLDQYLAARGLDGAETVAREQAQLPMTPLSPRAATSRVVPIGVAGGCARASSGYAFLAIQRTAAALAVALRAGRAPASVRPWRRRALAMDRIFLSVLEQQPTRAPGLFASLFARTPPSALVRFLADSDSWLDALRVVAALPKRPFLAAGWRELRGRGSVVAVDRRAEA
ncbi:MAG: lycopene cyclase family protein [Acidobacteriota bacterium]